MSRFVEVSPLPPTTTLTEIQEAFNMYAIKRFQKVGNRVYLEFEDPNDV